MLHLNNGANTWEWGQIQAVSNIRCTSLKLQYQDFISFFLSVSPSCLLHSAGFLQVISSPVNNNNCLSLSAIVDAVFIPSALSKSQSCQLRVNQPSFERFYRGYTGVICLSALPCVPCLDFFFFFSQKQQTRMHSAILYL